MYLSQRKISIFSLKSICRVGTLFSVLNSRFLQWTSSTELITSTKVIVVSSQESKDKPFKWWKVNERSTYRYLVHFCGYPYFRTRTMSYVHWKGWSETTVHPQTNNLVPLWLISASLTTTFPSLKFSLRELLRCKKRNPYNMPSSFILLKIELRRRRNRGRMWS